MLTPTDLKMFARFRVGADLLQDAVERVTDREARDKLSIARGRAGNFAGLLFNYLNPANGQRWTSRLRRDHPEIENGKPKDKYISAYGDRKHLFFPPKCQALLADPTVPIILVESEKASLALTAWSLRTGFKALTLAMGGCWGWRGRIGKQLTPSGSLADEKGPIRDLNCCNGRRVYVMLDANASQNPKVEEARHRLCHELRKRKCEVLVCDLPAVAGVNGPDDLIAVRGDAALSAVFASAHHPVTRDGLVTFANGKIKTCLNNCIVLLQRSPAWEGVLAFDEFAQKMVVKNPTPWPRPERAAEWVDLDDIQTTAWLHRNGQLVDEKIAASAVKVIAHENRFHPVREYLNSLAWDGQPRIASWLHVYLGAVDNDYTRAIGSRWLISAVARIFEPGCQADHVLLLEGPQGVRKSSALRVLAGDAWFTDHVSELGSKDSRIELLGKWIIEQSELNRIRRAELEDVKAFVTARYDKFRPPYGRHTESFPRSCIFAATTNDDSPLRDETGNRRFWPVKVGQVNLALLSQDRDQLWAEAVVEYRAGEPWHLETDELAELATQEQRERYEPGQWDDIILDWVDDPVQRQVPSQNGGGMVSITPFDSNHELVTILDVLQHAVGIPLDRIRKPDQDSVIRCLKHHGWKRSSFTSSRGKRRCYRPPEQRTLHWTHPGTRPGDADSESIDFEINLEK